MKFILVALISLLPSLSFSQENNAESEKNQVSIEIDILPGESVKNVIEASHALIEGDESGKFLEDWKEAVNFKKKLIDAYRWISATKSGSIQGVVLDSVLLFGMSHSLETSSGPIFVTMGVSHGWPEWLTAALGVGGAIISVPGLDPLCIAIFGIYSKSATFRAVIGQFRMALVRSAQGIGSVTGATEALKKIFARPDYKEWLSEIHHLDELREMKDGRVMAQYTYPSLENPELKIEVEVGSGRAFVKRIWVNKDITVRTRELSISWLKKFGWNTRQFVEKFVIGQVLVDKSVERPYIANIVEEGQWKVITLLDSAIATGPIFKIVNPLAPPMCQQIFAR